MRFPERARQVTPEEHPEVSSWLNSLTGNPRYINFLTHNTTIGVWLSLSRLFWPHFKEVQGCVLWEGFYNPDNFQMWHRELNGDPQSLEATINRLRMWDIIDCEDSPADNAALDSIADSLRNCWAAALREKYPNIDFSVVVIATEDGPIVSFARR